MTHTDLIQRILVSCIPPALYALHIVRQDAHFWAGNWHTYLRLYGKDAIVLFLWVFAACLVAEFLLFQLGLYVFRPVP